MRHPFWARLATLSVVAGLGIVVIGIFMATVWAPERTATTSVPAGRAPLVVTAPGFLAMNGARVAVVARSAAATPVFLGVARAGDAGGYVADAQHTTVVGLTSHFGALTTSTGVADATDPVPDPSDVDIWVDRASGAGVAKLTWVNRPGAWSLVAAGDGRSAAPGTLTFTWELPERPSAAPAVIALGVLLLVSGVIGLALSLAPARLQLPPAEPPVPPGPGGSPSEQRMEWTR